MNNFYIEVKHYGETIRIELDHSDLDLGELAEVFRKVSYAMGFSPASVDEMFDEDYL